jgi:hypothetical protein
VVEYARRYLAIRIPVGALERLSVCTALSHAILVHTLQTRCKYYAVTYPSVKEFVAGLDAQKARKQIFTVEISFAA